MKAGNKTEQRTIYAPPLIFAAACGLLAIIIGVFAISNVKREKHLMVLALDQEARAIVNLVSAGFRGNLKRGNQKGMAFPGNWIETINEHIVDSSEHSRLHALYLTDRNGLIRAHTDQAAVGAEVDVQVQDRLFQMIEGKRREMSELTTSAPGAENVYRMVVRYQVPAWIREGGGMDRFGQQRRPADPPLHKGLDESARASLQNAPFFLVVELELEEFREAIQTQIFQVVILSIVLLLVGVGGLLSLILIQNYKGSQRRLRRMSTYTDMIVSSLPIGLTAITGGGKIRTCNGSAAHMLNIDQEKCLGQAIDRVFGADLTARINKDCAEKPSYWEMSFVDRDGAERALHFSCLPIEDEDSRHPGTVLLVQDLSQIRELEVQLRRAERDAVVGRMAAGVAHELRNPLSSIKGLALLLKSKLGQDGDALNAADLMTEQVDRLNRTISELLDYARPAALKKTDLHVDDLLAKAVSLVSTDAEAAGIDLVEHYECPDCQIHGDEDKLIQVFLNLSLNALQAMNSGGTLQVVTGRKNGEAVISLIDTGDGIPEDLKERIFEPYFTTKHEGTGLGLPMSAKIIDDHDGSIAVVSTGTDGTTVTVKLPCY